MDCKLYVSIIINNYNYDRFLADAIDSALNQTYTNIEVIVVDDGSTDNSRNVIAQYGDRIIPLLQANGKQGAAFNHGFAHSKGDIILFLDSDDYLHPHGVERIVAAWKPGLSKVHYRLDVVDETDQPREFSYPQGGKPLESGEVWRSLLRVGTYVGVPTSGNALSRQALAQIFPIPEAYKTTSDDYLSVLVPLFGEVAAIEEALGAYRIHGNNQWALVAVTSDRFRRFVHHDQQRCKLLTQKASELGHQVPDDLELRFFGRVWSRLMSLRLDPEQHPVPEDRPVSLVYAGILSLWKYSDHNWQKRIIFSLWFIWVGLAPLPLAKPAITWLMAPQLRPKVISRTITKLRSMVS